MAPAPRTVRARVRSGLNTVRMVRYPIASHEWLQPSFSQTGEDRIVMFLFQALGVSKPSYLDVGAYHPFHLSNTALLSITGSRGINVDPDPDAISRFRKHRPKDTNLNIGCGDETGLLTFYRLTAPTLNSFSKDSADQAVAESGGRFSILETVPVQVRTVTSVIEDAGYCPDFLSLDVEGLDQRILATMGDWRALPTVVCVETITYSEHGNGVKLTGITDLMEGLGYLAFADTNINTVFVLKDRWTNH